MLPICIEIFRFGCRMQFRNVHSFVGMVVVIIKALGKDRNIAANKESQLRGCTGSCCRYHSDKLLMLYHFTMLSGA